MNDLISRQAAIAETHSAIYEFFDIDEEDTESPITYMDERLLEINKAISTRVQNIPAADISEQLENAYAHGYTAAEAEFRKVMEADRWIPVTERLPEESGVYLVTRHSYIGSKQNYTDIVCYGYPEDGKRRKNRVWYFTDSEYGDIAIGFDKVIAWCDLPQPHEEADE